MTVKTTLTPAGFWVSSSSRAGAEEEQRKPPVRAYQRAHAGVRPEGRRHQLSAVTRLVRPRQVHAVVHQRGGHEPHAERLEQGIELRAGLGVQRDQQPAAAPARSEPAPPPPRARRAWSVRGPAPRSRRAGPRSPGPGPRPSGRTSSFWARSSSWKARTVPRGSEVSAFMRRPLAVAGGDVDHPGRPADQRESPLHLGVQLAQLALRGVQRVAGEVRLVPLTAAHGDGAVAVHPEGAGAARGPPRRPGARRGAAGSRWPATRRSPALPRPPPSRGGRRGSASPAR